MSNNLCEITNAQLHSLAKRHLSGETSVDLVGFGGLDLDKIRALLKSDRMAPILNEEQQRLDATASRIRNRMSYGIEDSVDRMKARGAGCDGPQIAYQADKFLIEELLPNKPQYIETNSNHTFDASLAVTITDAINTFKTITDTSKGNGADDDTYTLHGTQGLVTSEPQATATELVVPVEPSSGSPSKAKPAGDPSGKPESPPTG